MNAVVALLPAALPRLQIVSPSSNTLTVEPYGFPMRCVFEFDAGEAPILFPTDRAHPGSPPSAQLLECWVGGVDILPMLSVGQLDRIEELLISDRESA